MSHQPLLPTDETSSKSDAIAVDKHVRRPTILCKFIDARGRRTKFAKRSQNVSFLLPDRPDVDEVVTVLYFQPDFRDKNGSWRKCILTFHEKVMIAFPVYSDANNCIQSRIDLAHSIHELVIFRLDFFWKRIWFGQSAPRYLWPAACCQTSLHTRHLNMYVCPTARVPHFPCQQNICHVYATFLMRTFLPARESNLCCRQFCARCIFAI